MNFLNSNDVREYLSKTAEIDFNISFSLAQACSKLLRDPLTENIGREIVIRIKACLDKVDNRTYPIWNDLCESAGLYPYLETALLKGSSVIRHEFHSSKYLKDIYFHEEQNKVSLELQSKNSVILSAPTSFGKSLLIEDIIASKSYNNIVVVQPTLALLDETRKKLLNYYDDYKIIVSTRQLPSDTLRNVFLFTPERVVEYENFPNIDFFVIDEFYKLSPGRKDDRGVILNHALNKLLHFTTLFYFLGPNVASVPAEFHDTFCFKWIDTNFSTVAVDEYPMTLTSPRDKTFNELRLFKLLTLFDEPTMIYCRSPQRTTELSEGFLQYLEDSNQANSHSTSDNDDIAQWIGINIHDRWILKSALHNSLAFHHGSLPRHLGSSIIDSFNNGRLQYLFCTSTIIEGVNTAAKNVVIFDKMKGRKRLDYFDYRNIAGRSGRMAQYFIGRVYNFHIQPDEKGVDVDIPLITQEHAPLELLIQIEKSQLKPSSVQRLAEFDNLDNELQSAIKKNSGLPVQGQIDLVNEIEQNMPALHPLLQWSSPFPSYYQLRATLDLAWRHLQSGAEHNIGSANQLTYLAFNYAHVHSISALINEALKGQFWADREPNFDKRVNKVVFGMLDISRHWFDFRLPKLLSAISTLQHYVFFKHGYSQGDYSFFANILEYGNFSPNVAMLLDYNVPPSAVVKISRHVDPEASQEDVLVMLAQSELEEFGLIPYEINKINAITRRKT